MRKLVTLMSVILLLISLGNCKKKDESLDDNSNKIIIRKNDSIAVELTNSLQLIKISIYNENILSEIREFDYYSDSISLTTKDSADQIKYYCIYYINSSGKADSMVHTSFFNDQETVTKYRNIFDSNGNKIQSILYNNSGNVYFDYHIENGNAVTISLSGGNYYYSFTSYENKLDIVLDYWDYFSLANANLVKRGGPCFDSHYCVRYDYCYTIDSNGLVLESIESDDSGDYRKISTYNYQFQ